MKRTFIVRDGGSLNEVKQESQGASVQIEKLVYGGEGLGRMDGQVVLVPFVLPGEDIAVEVHRVKNGLLRSSHSEILKPSPDRIQPRCPYFGECGGCHYQHAPYETQLSAKREILLETLNRLGTLKFPGEVTMISAQPWYYRNRVQLHFAHGCVGYHKAGSHDLCPIDHCPISSPKLNEVIATLAKAVKQKEWPRFLQSLELFTNETEVQLNIIDSTRPVASRFFEWCKSFIPGLASGPIDYGAAGHTFRIGRGSFFQVNRLLTDRLVNVVVEGAEGKRALDLYAGVGLFTLPLSARVDELEAVERGGSACRDLEWNVRGQAEKIKVSKQRAEAFLQAKDGSIDLIVADPPRVGLGKEITKELLRLKSPELRLVSCDPATLARDLKTLSAVYQVEQLTLVDLFPQTYHFETVVRLRVR